MTEPVCPQCGTRVEQHWDWCHNCGFNPTASLPPSSPIPGQFAPPTPPPPAWSPALTTHVAGSQVEAAHPISRRGPMIVAAVAIACVALLAGVVLLGHRPTPPTVDAVAASDGTPAASTSATQTAPTSGGVTIADLRQQYLDAVGPSNAAEDVYSRECGCSTGSFNLQGAVHAVPALLVAEKKELADLTAIADVAPEPIAADLRGFVDHKSVFPIILARIADLGPAAPESALRTEFQTLASASRGWAYWSALSRKDLGLPPST